MILITNRLKMNFYNLGGKSIWGFDPSFFVTSLIFSSAKNLKENFSTCD